MNVCVAVLVEGRSDFRATCIQQLSFVQVWLDHVEGVVPGVGYHVHMFGLWQELVKGETVDGCVKLWMVGSVGGCGGWGCKRCDKVCSGVVWAVAGVCEG